MLPHFWEVCKLKVYLDLDLFLLLDIYFQQKKISCNLQNECAFKFSQIVTDADADKTKFGLTCLDSSGTTFTHIPLAQTYFKVTYQCDAPRQRYRPFSNKRYDSKFSPSAFHHIRHPSNNRFVA
jgi:hypothetical protein